MEQSGLAGMAPKRDVKATYEKQPS
jgi:hypothetical protein